MNKKIYYLRIEVTWKQEKQINRFVDLALKLFCYRVKKKNPQFNNVFNIPPCIMYWDNYKQDMKELSKKFPECLFILDIAGFKPYDIERVYFQSGKMQKARVDIEYTDPNDIDWEE